MNNLLIGCKAYRKNQKYIDDTNFKEGIIVACEFLQSSKESIIWLLLPDETVETVYLKYYKINKKDMQRITKRTKEHKEASRFELLDIREK